MLVFGLLQVQLLMLQLTFMTVITVKSGKRLFSRKSPLNCLTVREANEHLEKLAIACPAFGYKTAVLACVVVVCFRQSYQILLTSIAKESTSLSGKRSNMHSASPVYLCPGSGGHGMERRREEAVEKREKISKKVGTTA